MNTPYYIVEEKLLRRNLALIKDVAERSGCQIILSFKAFALWKTFSIFREYIPCVSACSPNEARLSFNEFQCRAHTYSPAFEDSTFNNILTCSSHITFNSIAQMEHFYPRVQKWNEEFSESPCHVGIRINPEYSHIETDLYNPTAPGSRLGVLDSQLEALPPEKISMIEGFLCHCHCESSAEDFVDNLRHIEEKFSRWFPQLKWLNLGGGHLMTRQGYNVELLVQTLQDLRHRYPNLSIILEPGSAFAWQTGPLVASVVDIVENHGIRTAILNVSFTCHMPDCLEMPYYPVVRECAADGAPYKYRLGGNSCLSGDFMDDFYFDHELRVGDTLHFEDMIHYTTVKTTFFNGIHHPDLYILREDGTPILLRHYTYDDYRNMMD